MTITTPRQNGTLTFSGVAGHRVFLQGSNGTIKNQVLGCDVNVSILSTDGTVLAPATCMEGDGFIDATTLPATGTYTIVVDPVSYAIGSLTLTLYDVPPDASGTITPGGPSSTVTISTPGQNATLTFSGTAQQRVSVYGSNGTISGQVVGCDVLVSIIRASDQAVVGTGTCMEGTGFMEPVSLPSTDAYTIVVDPAGIATGSLTLTLYNVPADVTGTLTINDTATPVSFSAPGQNALLTFTVTATQLVTVRVTNNGVPGITTVSLLNGGTTITTWSSFDSGFNLPQQSLSPGTYTVKIDPAAQNTGTLSIQVTSP